MEKINIAELLHNCPQGMELDCTMYDNVYFKCIREHAGYPIVCYTIDSKGETEEITFDWYGKYAQIDTAKCVIFPKGKTTWEGFVPPCQFKDGDIAATDCNCSESQLFIVSGGDSQKQMKCYVSLFEDGKLDVDAGNYYVTRYATEEEKQKLFKAIKDNGYKWNPETKTLDKLIQPKFKVGDRVKYKDGKNIEGVKQGVILSITDDTYDVAVTNDIGIFVPIANQDQWELVPNKLDITTLKPFDKVLVRDANTNRWDITFYELYDNTNITYPYRTLGGMIYKQCIPYEGNEHLLGKTDDCKNFYKTWE